MYLWVGRGYTVHGIAMSKQPSWAPCLDPPTLSGGPEALPFPPRWPSGRGSSTLWAQPVSARVVSGPGLRAFLHPRFSLPAFRPPAPTCHLPQTESWESRRASRVRCETRPTATRSTPPLTLASLGPFSVSGHAVLVGVVPFLVTPDHGGG